MNVEFLGNDSDPASDAAAARSVARAGVWSTLIEGLSNVGMTIAAATGISREPVVVSPAGPGGTAPVVINVPSTNPGAIDPTMLAVVGIPAVLIGMVLLKRRRR